MVSKLKINTELCSACKLCKFVCIRNNIDVDSFAFELESNCFECGHCMAICPNGAISLVAYEDQDNRIQDYTSISIGYDDLLQFFKQRRSIRWFKNKKIDKITFNKLFEGAYYSPSAQNMQDVEFVVLDKDLDAFMNIVHDIIKVREDEFFRIKEFGDYLNDNSLFDHHPLLWDGSQLILTFSSDKTSAVIANSRLELLAYSLGLGGFYSLFIIMADEINHDLLMDFFPNINKDKHLFSAFIIGYPKLKFKRTVPHNMINVDFR